MASSNSLDDHRRWDGACTMHVLILGGKQIGEESIQGYDCEVWEMMGVKFWVHKGLALKTEGKMMGMRNSMVATRIDLGASVSEDDLKLPNFPIRDASELRMEGDEGMPQMTPEQMRQMQQMMQGMMPTN